MRRIFGFLLVFVILLVGCGKKDVSINDITKEFKNENLNTANLKEMKKEDYHLSPMTAEKAVIFDVQGNMHARLFKFKNQDDLKQTKEYYEKIGKSSAIFASHLYQKGNFLIQANGDIPEETFNKYKKVMDKTIEE